MKHLIKLYDDWLPVKEVFKKPVLHWYFGKWRNDPCLPVWRRGPIIHFKWKNKEHTIKLPIWLSFYIFNWEMSWKTKYDEYRYEFPPQFTIVFFGLSLSFWLKAPYTEVTKNIDDHYWEAVMYYQDNLSLREAIEGAGIWSINLDNKTSYFALRPEFLQPKMLEEYYTLTKEIKKDKNII